MPPSLRRQLEKAASSSGQQKISLAPALKKVRSSLSLEEDSQVEIPSSQPHDLEFAEEPSSQIAPGALSKRDEQLAEQAELGEQPNLQTVPDPLSEWNEQEQYAKQAEPKDMWECLSDIDDGVISAWGSDSGGDSLETPSVAQDATEVPNEVYKDPNSLGSFL